MLLWLHTRGSSGCVQYKDAKRDVTLMETPSQALCHRLSSAFGYDYGLS